MKLCTVKRFENPLVFIIEIRYPTFKVPYNKLKCILREALDCELYVLTVFGDNYLKSLNFNSDRHVELYLHNEMAIKGFELHWKISTTLDLMFIRVWSRKRSVLIRCIKV